MKVNKLILTILFASFAYASMAQVAIDPTGKRFMKPRERTKFGGPTPNTHKMPVGPENINITFIEIEIDPMEKGGIQITARGTKTPKIRGCDDCTVAGRIIVNGAAAKELASTSNDETVKQKQEKNAAAGRIVTFRNQANQDYTVATNAEGSFMMTALPNGTYSIWVGGKKVITDFILKTVEPSPEELAKEEELKKQLEARRQQSANTPGTQPAPQNNSTDK